MIFEENDSTLKFTNIRGPIIYFLIFEDEVVYVGQSKQGICRPFQHTTRTFDSVCIKRCEEDELDYLESKYILKYRPKYNKSILNSYSYSYKKVRELLRNQTYFKDFTLNDLKYIVKKLNVKIDVFEGVNYIARHDFEKIEEFLTKNLIASNTELRKKFV